MTTDIDKTYKALKQRPIDEVGEIIIKEINNEYDYNNKRMIYLSVEAHWEMIARIIMKHHWDPLEYYRARANPYPLFNSEIEHLTRATEKIKKELEDEQQTTN